MNTFEQALMSAVPELEKEPGDYEKDGIVYCGKCNTPRQIHLPAPGTALDGRLVIISCKCREAAYSANLAEKKAKENRDKLSAHIRETIEAGVAEPFPAATFDLDDQPERRASKLARGYVEKWDLPEDEDGTFANNIGIMFYGPPGTGKTFLAGCIANALHDRLSHVLYTSIRKLATAAARNFGADADYVEREVRRCSLLVLDDFGVERDTEYSWEQTERIINWRYDSGKPTIATTNLSPADMKDGDITLFRFNV